MGENYNLKDLIDNYSKLSVGDKRRELGREIAELSLVIKKLLNDSLEGVEQKNSLDEYDNLFDSNLTETDYLTGLYEDIINLKDILGLYLSTVIIEKINQ